MKILGEVIVILFHL